MAKQKKSVIITLTILAALFLCPLIVTFTNSFMTEDEIGVNYNANLSSFDIVDGVNEKFINIELIPKFATFSQYATVLINQPSFLILLTNSLKITVPVVALNLLISLAAAYGFTAWRFKYKEAIFFAYIVVMLMPLQAVLVPNYIVANFLNFTEGGEFLGVPKSWFAIILPGIFAPFGTFLLRQTMKAIPPEMYEAARIDGANDFLVFLHIVCPQMKSGVCALIMLWFIEYWNVVEQSVVFIKEYYNEPLSVFLSRMATSRTGLIFAASCVYMLPPFLFLLFGQEDLEKGIELSGVK